MNQMDMMKKVREWLNANPDQNNGKALRDAAKVYDNQSDPGHQKGASLLIDNLVTDYMTDHATADGVDYYQDVDAYTMLEVEMKAQVKTRIAMANGRLANQNL